MIVITGAAGFIGSCLAWKLNETGRRDLLLVDHDANQPPKIYNLKSRKFVDYLEKDAFARELGKGRWTQDIEAIFHLGACSDTLETDKEYLWENNVRYSQRLAEWAFKEGKRFLYASSAATYGDGSRGYSDDETKLPELEPLNLYGQSKHLFDVWVLENKLERKFVGFKFFNVFGPNEYHKAHMRSVVHKGYHEIKKEGKMRLFRSYKKEYADGEQKRDFIYVKDAVEVMMWFFEHPVTGIFNLGRGKAETWNELARAMFAALKLKEAI